MFHVRKKKAKDSNILFRNKKKITCGRGMTKAPAAMPLACSIMGRSLPTVSSGCTFGVHRGLKRPFLMDIYTIDPKFGMS